jgi:hypothetical protein
MTAGTQDYKWLETHINSAVEDVKKWPKWKSRGSTLASQPGATEAASEGDSFKKSGKSESE